ncbi:hypothetical protein HDU79_005738, partial [Rhizoclosmatium sp. JEL0117]
MLITDSSIGDLGATTKDDCVSKCQQTTTTNCVAVTYNPVTHTCYGRNFARGSRATSTLSNVVQTSATTAISQTVQTLSTIGQWPTTISTASYLTSTAFSFATFTTSIHSLSSISMTTKPAVPFRALSPPITTSTTFISASTPSSKTSFTLTKPYNGPSTISTTTLIPRKTSFSILPTSINQKLALQYYPECEILVKSFSSVAYPFNCSSIDPNGLYPIAGLKNQRRRKDYRDSGGGLKRDTSKYVQFMQYQVQSVVLPQLGLSQQIPPALAGLKSLQIL